MVWRSIFNDRKISLSSKGISLTKRIKCVDFFSSSFGIVKDSSGEEETTRWIGRFVFDWVVLVGRWGANIDGEIICLERGYS